MGEDRHNEKLMIQYLLGELSEKRSEQLDELCFIDEDFSKRLRAVEDDLIDAYVRGELSEHEQAQFRRHYLASPMRREKVEFAKAFTTLISETPMAEPSIPALMKPISWWQSLSNSLSTQTRGFQYLLATMVLIMLVGGPWLIIEIVRLRNLVEQFQLEQTVLKQREQELQEKFNNQHSYISQLAEEYRRVSEQFNQLKQSRTNLPSELKLVSFILKPGVRDFSESEVLSIPANTDSVEFKLVLEQDDYKSYSAELRQTDNKKIWSGGKLKARMESSVKVVDARIPARRFTENSYILTLRGETHNGRKEDVRGYAFRIKKERS